MLVGLPFRQTHQHDVAADSVSRNMVQVGLDPTTLTL